MVSRVILTGRAPLAKPVGAGSNSGMNLESIETCSDEADVESLVAALRAVAAAEGAGLDRDDLCAALGVSFAAVAVAGEPSPQWWQCYGRDVFLEPAARLFGLELRDLHPPDVGVDMLAADEFPQHYDISYKPLIRRALENGQPVLAWRGWAGVNAPRWGVITRQAADAFEGVLPFPERRLTPHDQPAMQCYVVERCAPCVPARDLLFQTAMEHADAFMEQLPFERGGPREHVPRVTTGPDAIRAWREWLEFAPFGDPAEDLTWKDHLEHAASLATSRAAAQRFLDVSQPDVPKPRHETLAEAADACAAQIRLLAESASEADLLNLWGTSIGHKTLLQALDALETQDRRLAACITKLRFI